VRCESSGFRPWKLNHGGSVSLAATQCVPDPGMVFESPDFRSSDWRRVFEDASYRESAMSTFRKYPEIVRLDKRPEILSVRQVVATEKLHGTNFRVFFPAGMTSLDEVRFGGRNEEFAAGDDGFYGGRPVRWFKQQPALMQRLFEVFASHGFADVTVFGEAFGAGIQKGVRYVPGDDVQFRAFDIMVGDNFVTYDLFVQLCEEAGLARVPEVWRGEPSVAAFDALLEQDSVLGKENGVSVERNVSEGVVIRATPLLRDVFGQWLIIKHKSEKFAEVAKRGPSANAVDLTPAQSFAETFVVEGRVTNALGRLRDRGVALENDMADMRVLVPELVGDLLKECSSEWQATITLGVNDKQIRSAVTKSLGSVYRRMLIARASS
jgi:Rnl2 family RNA ligase